MLGGLFMGAIMMLGLSERLGRMRGMGTTHTVQGFYHGNPIFIPRQTKFKGIHREQRRNSFGYTKIGKKKRKRK